MRLTARQRALPALRVEANRRLAAVEACPEGAWADIDDACSWLAQHIAPDVQPDWDSYPLGTCRYNRLRYRRKDK